MDYHMLSMYFRSRGYEILNSGGNKENSKNKSWEDYSKEYDEEYFERGLLTGNLVIQLFCL